MSPAPIYIWLGFHLSTVAHNWSGSLNLSFLMAQRLSTLWFLVLVASLAIQLTPNPGWLPILAPIWQPRQLLIFISSLWPGPLLFLCQSSHSPYSWSSADIALFWIKHQSPVDVFLMLDAASTCRVLVGTKVEVSASNAIEPHPDLTFRLFWVTQRFDCLEPVYFLEGYRHLLKE